MDKQALLNEIYKIGRVSRQTSGHGESTEYLMFDICAGEDKQLVAFIKALIEKAHKERTEE